MIIGRITEMGFPQKNQNGRKYEAIVEDRLSRLPDELIVDILSRLTLRESGRTCVLSRRWQRLWLFTTHCSGPNLIFKIPIYLELFVPSLCDSCDVLRRKRLLYIGLLNKVFGFYQTPLLDELVLILYLPSEFFGAIDNWIKFALTKGVQRLELDLLKFCSEDFPDYEEGRPYVFPCLHDEKFTSRGVHRLRDLCLKGVYVDQHVVDALLATFPLLDSLSFKLPKPRDLKISSDRLKRLELSNCIYCSYEGERVEISAPCLVTLRYEGSMSALRLKCVPCLSELYVSATDISAFFLENDRRLSCIAQLKKLYLYVTSGMIIDSPAYPMAFPEFVKLEELEMKIAGSNGRSFLWPTVFVKASPFLRRLAIEMDVYIHSLKVPSTLHSEEEKIRIKEATTFQHRFLKVIEICRFSGSSSEIELAQHLFGIGARSLQKVVIDTQPGLIEKPPDEIDGIKKLAQSIRKGLDSSVDFVVL